MLKHLRHLFTRKEHEETQTMLLPPAAGTDRKPCSTSLFPFASVTGVKPSPAFHRDLWYSDQNRSHRQYITLTLSRHVQFRDGQRQDVGPLFTFTKGSSHFLWVIWWLKAIVLGSMVCSSADRHAVSVDLSPQKQ